MRLSSSEVGAFREQVWEYYRQAGRRMPWRDDPSPYRVLVSELMLQQTQVSRVVPKFETFMYTCDSFASLANVPLSTVLELWSGLGYNRRAKYLHQTARIVVHDYDGLLPSSRDELIKLPGVGTNTAGAILAYAYNQPVVFIETNIRTVYFHHFYADHADQVSDKQLETLVEQTLDRDNPREWYWALMDYGAFLKKTVGGRLSSSSHYVKQTPLKGSAREMRGRILRALITGKQDEQLLRETVLWDERFEPALAALSREGLIEKTGGYFRLTGDSETT